MKKALLIIALVMTAFGFAQTAETKQAANAFKTAFNNSDFEAIYNSFDTEMQAEFPMERTLIFYTRMRATRGEIQEITFNKQKNKASVYTIKFEKATMNLVLQVNAQNKYSQLFLVAQDAAKE